MLVLFGNISMKRQVEIYVNCLLRRSLSGIYISSSFYRLFFLQSMNPINVLRVGNILDIKHSWGSKKWHLFSQYIALDAQIPGYCFWLAMT